MLFNMLPPLTSLRLKDGIDRVILAGGGPTDAEVYNSQTDEWTVLPSTSGPLSRPFSYVHNGHTFFMGGGIPRR